MYHEFNQIGHLPLHFRKLLVRQTRREIILPVPVPEALHRLQIAFATTITISKGFLFARYKYTGQVHDTEIDVQLSVRAGSNMDYSMHGQLFTHPKGTRLVMIVKDETPLFFLMAVILAGTFILHQGAGGIIFLAIYFLVLLFPVMAWHRGSAANSISGLLYKIVSKQ